MEQLNVLFIRKQLILIIYHCFRLDGRGERWMATVMEHCIVSRTYVRIWIFAYNGYFKSDEPETITDKHL